MMGLRVTAIVIILMCSPASLLARTVSSTDAAQLIRQIGSSGYSDAELDLNVPIDIPAIGSHSAIRLMATVVHHTQSRQPTILTATPYRRELWVLLYIELVRHGYNLIAVDVRGTGESLGQWTVLGQEEQTDLAYIIDHWIPSQTWSDGRVGMFGASYQAENEIDAAGHVMTDPDGSPTHLKALLPMVPLADPYSDFMMKGGNCHWLGIMAYFGGIDLLSLLPTSSLLGIADLADIGDLYTVFLDHLQSFELHFNDWLGNADNMLKSDLWRSRSTMLYFPDRPSGSGWNLPEGGHAISNKLPTMIMSGWWCILERGALLNYQHGLKRHAAGDKALIMGPWYHLDGGFGLGLQGFMFTQAIASRWFDWKIKGAPDPFMREFPVLLYIMGADRWRAEKDWPLPASRVEAKTLYLTRQPAGAIEDDWFSSDNQPNNYLLSETDTAWNYQGTDPVMRHDPSKLHGLTSHSAVRQLMGLQAFPMHYQKYVFGPDYELTWYWSDERKDEVGVPTFTTAELEQDVEITGPLKLAFWASTIFPSATNAQIDTALNTLHQWFPFYKDTLLAILDRKDVQWVIEINDVYPDGQARNITSGWLAASHRPYDPEDPTHIDPAYTAFDPYYDRGDTAPNLIQEHTAYPYVIEIWPTAMAFKKGHRIRVSISGSDFPHLLPILWPSLNTIIIDQAHPATLSFDQVGQNDEGRTWKWVDSGEGSVCQRFKEANAYLLTHQDAMSGTDDASGSDNPSISSGTASQAGETSSGSGTGCFVATARF